MAMVIVSPSVVGEPERDTGSQCQSMTLNAVSNYMYTTGWRRQFNTLQLIQQTIRGMYARTAESTPNGRWMALSTT